MKNRFGHVSNSSSSSFICIGNKEIIPLESVSDPYVIGEDGCTEFGWGPEKLTDVHSRINFSYLQAFDNEDLMEMLTKSIINNSNVSNVESIIDPSWDCDRSGDMVWGYIDHESSKPDNMEMFDDEDSLDRFLFACDSSITVDNDNH